MNISIFFSPFLNGQAARGFPDFGFNFMDAFNPFNLFGSMGNMQQNIQDQTTAFQRQMRQQAANMPGAPKRSADGRSIYYDGVDSLSFSRKLGGRFYKITNTGNTVHIQENGVGTAFDIGPNGSQEINLCRYTDGSFELHLSGIPRGIKVFIDASNASLLMMDN